MRGAVSAPGGFRSFPRKSLTAGWRRADLLRGAVLQSRERSREALIPLDSEENSATLKAVDANVPPDQPPSTPDNPAARSLLLGLSASGTAFEPFTFPLSSPSASVTISGCGVTPPGLTN